MRATPEERMALMIPGDHFRARSMTRQAARRGLLWSRLCTDSNRHLSFMSMLDRGPCELSASRSLVVENSRPLDLEAQ